MTTKAYISRDTILSLDDSLIFRDTESEYWALDCSKGCNSLQKNASFYFNFDCDDNFKSGTYYLLVALDATDILSETNENNNVGYSAFKYTNYDCGFVDVDIDSRSYFEQGESISPFELRVNFRNSSSEDYTMFFISYEAKLLLSSDLIVDTNDMKLNQYNNIMLRKDRFSSEPCQNLPFFQDTINAYTYTNTFSFCEQSYFAIPNTVPSGTYYLLLQTNQFYQPSFVRYTSPPIQIGTSATSIDKAESFVRSSAIKQAYDLTGKEIDEKNRAGKLLIVVDQKGSRKLMKFD